MSETIGAVMAAVDPADAPMAQCALRLGEGVFQAAELITQAIPADTLLGTYLRIAENCAGSVYMRVSGMVHDLSTWTHEHPEIQRVLPLAQSMLSLVGINVAPQIEVANLILGAVGRLAAADPTVQGPMPPSSSPPPPVS